MSRSPHRAFTSVALRMLLLLAATWTSGTGTGQAQDALRSEQVTTTTAATTASSNASSTAGAFVPDLFSGTASLAIPLEVPAGRRGVQPSLLLSYRSGAPQSWTGVGWDLTVPSIDRAQKFGVDYTSQQYVFRVNGSSIELATVTGTEFRATVESAFTRFFQRTDRNTGSYWEAVDRNGWHHTFGRTAASRQDDPDDDTHVFRWVLERVEDPYGNFIDFDYSKDQGQLYLDRISYTGNARLSLSPDKTVRFVTEPSGDTAPSYSLGFKVVTAKRLKLVAIQAGGTLYKAYVLSYSSSGATGRPLLRSLQEAGSDAQYDPIGAIVGGTRLAPQQLLWSEDRTNFSRRFTATAIDLGYDDGRGWADANGDGRSDYCRLVGNTGSTQGIACLLATANGFSGEIRSTGNIDWGYADSRSWTDVTGDGRADYCRNVGNTNGQSSRVSCLVSTGTQFAGEISSGVIDWGYVAGRAWTDVNADGRADYCRLVGNVGVTQGVACLLAGDNTFAGEIRTSGNIDWGYETSRRWTDINGDGRSDFCRNVGNVNGQSSGVACLTSTGQSFGVEVRSGVIDWGFESGRAWVDANGDGRADYCRLVGNVGATQGVACLLGSGTGFDGNIASVGNIDWGYPDGRFWVDINGDGRADFCRTVGNANGQSSYVSCLTSNGLGFGSEVTSGVEDWGHQPGRAFVDVSGDNRADFCRAIGDANSASLLCSVSSASSADLLIGHRSSVGASTSLEYQPAAVFNNRQLPIAIVVLSAMTVDDGNGHAARTDYNYEGGFYRPSSRDFRGFRRVTTRSPITQDGQRLSTEVTFLQGDGMDAAADSPEVATAFMKGKPARIATIGSAGDLIAETTYTYGLLQPGPHYFAPVTRLTTTRRDIFQQQRTTASTFKYDTVGNVITEEQLGDVSTPADDRTVEMTFSANHSEGIVGLVLTEALFQGIGPDRRQVAGATYSYDGAERCGPVPTIVSSTRPRGNLTRIVPWRPGSNESIATHFRYDEAGNLLCKQDPRGGTTRLAYDDTLTFAIEVRDALDHVVRTSYYGVQGESLSGGLFGLTRQLVDANGATTRTEYDALGRRSRLSLPDDTEWTQWYYEDIGVVGRQRTRVETSAGLTSTEYFDGLGRVIKVHKRGPSASTIATLAEYDIRGRLSRSSSPFFDGRETPRWSTRSYANDNTLISIEHPDQSIRRYCRDVFGVISIDENGSARRHDVDVSGRLMSVVEYAEPLTACPVTLPERTGLRPYSRSVYEWDVRGNLIKTTDAAGNVTERRFNELNWLTESYEPNLGRWSYEHDRNGNVTKQTAPSNRVTYLRYDGLNRPIQKDYQSSKPLGQGDVRYRYDGVGVNAIGRLSEVSNGMTRVLYKYDRLGRETQVDRYINGARYTTKATYDSASRIRRIDYPGGSHVSYTYNGPVLESVRDDATVFAQFESYSAMGQPGRVTYGNGTVATYLYNSSQTPQCIGDNGRLCEERLVLPGGETAYENRLAYDPAGNVLETSDSLTGPRAFFYDSVNRLRGVASISGTVDDALRRSVAALDATPDGELKLPSSADMRWLDAYSYDATGNIQWTLANGTYRYASPGTPRPHAVIQAGAERFQYDATGQLEAGYGRRFSYTNDGQVSRMSSASNTVSLSYDGAGDKALRVDGGATTTYIGKMATCQAGSCTRYVFAGDVRIASLKGSEQRYYLTDYLGSTRVVSDERGRIVWTGAYSPFGQLMTVNGGVPPAQLFAGKERVLQSRVYDFGARYYDSQIGRFLSPDAAGPRLALPQSLNRYSFALNNPLTLTDPDGNIAWFVPIIAGAIIGGVQAAMRHDDVLKGMAIGAVAGAFTAGAGAVGGGLLTYAAAGAGSGATNAAIWGGDVGNAALYGAALSAIGYVAGGVEVDMFGDGPIGGTLDYAATGAARGAVFGAGYAAATGRDVGNGALVGAGEGAAGAYLNMFVGHVVGGLRSGTTPKWERGAWVYESADRDQTPVTIGNVISGGAGRLGQPATMLENGKEQPVTDRNGKQMTVFDHELSHVSQGTMLGSAYLPLHGLSLLVGGAIGAAYPDSVGFDRGHHRYNVLERWWTDVPDYN